MITNTLEHLVECLDECVLGGNRLCFLNGKLSVLNPEKGKKEDKSLIHFR